MTLPELNPHTYQNLLQLKYLQKNLHKLLLPPKTYTLPVDIPQDLLIHSSKKPPEELNSLLVPETNFHSPSEDTSILPYHIPFDNPMVEHISPPPSTPSNSTIGDLYPLQPKQTQN